MAILPSTIPSALVLWTVWTCASGKRFPGIPPVLKLHSLISASRSNLQIFTKIQIFQERKSKKKQFQKFQKNFLNIFMKMVHCARYNIFEDF